MRVMVTGGCGYKGSVLVPKLLAQGHQVTVVDTAWFGDHLGNPPGMTMRKQDLRDGVDCSGHDAIIHLAGIANDPCGELDAKLTWEVNALQHLFLMESAVKAGVKQFIYASSASVYGIQGNQAVTEDSPLAPVSDYNKTKMVAERITMSFKDKMAVQIVRPATICGVSPRMRLDVVVNMLTIRALVDGVIEVKTPDLYRPHCHIEDVTDLYCWLLERPHLSGPFNAGFDNQTIMETANLIRERVKCELKVAPPTPGKFDKRSYLVDSTRLIEAGFTPKRSVRTAVADIVIAYKAGMLKETEQSVNLLWMLKNGWAQGHG